MSLLILLVYSFELYLNITYQCLSRCVCKAPDVLGTCSVLSTLKRGPSGKQDSRACQGRHRCTGSHRAAIVQTTFTHRHTHTHIPRRTHTYTHLGWDAAAKCHCAELNQRASCCLAGIHQYTGLHWLSKCRGQPVADWLTDWLIGHPMCPNTRFWIQYRLVIVNDRW